jgi:hypothetical protein
MEHTKKTRCAQTRRGAVLTSGLSLDSTGLLWNRPPSECSGSYEVTNVLKHSWSSDGTDDKFHSGSYSATKAMVL